VQFDRTAIAVRERGMLEILDLSLQVMRVYFGPLLAAFAWLAVPLALLNYLLIGWMAEFDYNEGNFFEYLWTMSLLVFLQAPLASTFVTLYLGKATFLQKPNAWQMLADSWRLLPVLATCQLFLRGVLPAMVFAWLIDPDDVFSGWHVALGAVALVVYLMRGARPFVNEIVLLERNPLFSRDKQVTTVARRSIDLHAYSDGTLFARHLGATLVALMLAAMVLMGFQFMQGVFAASWSWGALMLHVLMPLSLWIVAFYMGVARFFCYLDKRIRTEGWEVELIMKAEAGRLARHST
jgi:hypothetical protein